VTPGTRDSLGTAVWLAVVLTSGCATIPIDGLHGAESSLPAECDSDWDGAFLGAAIGLSPIVWSVLTSRPGDDAPLGLKLGVVGGIAGFWIGLAVDSRICGDPP
jgi:hypothetical protein